MDAQKSSTVIQRWPDESREAMKLFIQRYGEANEVTERQTIWRSPGPKTSSAAPSSPKELTHDASPE